MLMRHRNKKDKSGTYPIAPVRSPSGRAGAMAVRTCALLRAEAIGQICLLIVALRAHVGGVGVCEVRASRLLEVRGHRWQHRPDVNDGFVH